MLINQVNIKRVSLSAERTGNNAYKISRDGTHVGDVVLTGRVWRYAIEGRRWSDGQRDSWRAAVLAVTRTPGVGLSYHGRVDSYGPCSAVRLQVDTAWYTVISNSAGLHIFQDYPGSPDEACNPDTERGIQIRRARDAAKKELEKLK